MYSSSTKLVARISSSVQNHNPYIPIDISGTTLSGLNTKLDVHGNTRYYFHIEPKYKYVQSKIPRQLNSINSIQVFTNKNDLNFRKGLDVKVNGKLKIYDICNYRKDGTGKSIKACMLSDKFNILNTENSPNYSLTDHSIIDSHVDRVKHASIRDQDSNGASMNPSKETHWMAEYLKYNNARVTYSNSSDSQQGLHVEVNGKVKDDISFQKIEEVRLLKETETKREKEGLSLIRKANVLNTGDTRKSDSKMKASNITSVNDSKEPNTILQNTKAKAKTERIERRKNREINKLNAQKLNEIDEQRKNIVRIERRKNKEIAKKLYEMDEQRKKIIEFNQKRIQENDVIFVKSEIENEPLEDLRSGLKELNEQRLKIVKFNQNSSLFLLTNEIEIQPFENEESTPIYTESKSSELMGNPMANIVLNRESMEIINTGKNIMQSLYNDEKKSTTSTENSKESTISSQLIGNPMASIVLKREAMEIINTGKKNKQRDKKQKIIKKSTDWEANKSRWSKTHKQPKVKPKLRRTPINNQKLSPNYTEAPTSELMAEVFSGRETKTEGESHSIIESFPWRNSGKDIKQSQNDTESTLNISKIKAMKIINTGQKLKHSLYNATETSTPSPMVDVFSIPDAKKDDMERTPKLSKQKGSDIDLNSNYSTANVIAKAGIYIPNYEDLPKWQKDKDAYYIKRNVDDTRLGKPAGNTGLWSEVGKLDNKLSSKVEVDVGRVKEQVSSNIKSESERKHDFEWF